MYGRLAQCEDSAVLPVAVMPGQRLALISATADVFSSSTVALPFPPVYNRIMHNSVMESDGPGAGVDSSESASALSALVEQLVRLLRQITPSTGLGTAAMMALLRLSREGPQRLTDLARAEGISQPGMTQLVSRLERERLVERTASEVDRRGVVVAATVAGKDFLDRRRAERAGALEQLLERLELDQQAAIVAAIPALARLVELRID
jgi:DNA-binding MarR family transcriptional regulator